MTRRARDPRSPEPKSEAVSRSMRSNKGEGTGPELRLRKALRDKGVGGYRLNWRKAPGRPDICYPGRRVAVFVHGCFWHRCPRCDLPIPVNNRGYWGSKFERNVERDRTKRMKLEDEGWTVITVWECELAEDLEGKAEEIASCIRAIDGRKDEG